ncbi:hypothetical protein LAX5112_04708 [Roseibium alexandrii]|uniref:Uncharacterized protein n=1 Tax=Roseibium alexandrii TaxID=388408 RepID=A0A0M7AQK0_9HYPH|nr:hypothetical protein LAX5112_04708 [Roseibium alexandrii]
MQHQGNLVVIRIAAAFNQGVPIDFDFASQLVDGLPEKVGQNIGAVAGCIPIRLRVSGCCQPYRQLVLNGSWLRDDADGLVASFKVHRVSAPEFPDGLNVPVHGCLVVRRPVFRAQNKVLRHPAGCKGKGNPAIAKVVNHRPLLGNPCRVVKGKHAAAGADRQVLRDGRNRCT